MPFNDALRLAFEPALSIVNTSGCPLAIASSICFADSGYLLLEISTSTTLGLLTPWYDKLVRIKQYSYLNLNYFSNNVLS